ncbi:diguanylate cyclase (GGDEF)-like protein [Anaerosolibacter carboniphilus]|uniref:Diguanylate cyclase (GGDEF)-like protein n=1 Tax=Anaerosolibacter carboniphilus TaxID=1417629 RepID=A0A841KVY8_9FIRM|nr:GGDEF domain-containing protein [Anaerosolibacter carboniphilus]MBB6217527.1 diguanylate cyclase (GGDEF)-like protein [Anaerosolibacter carboniphilus]
MKINPSNNYSLEEKLFVYMLVFFILLSVVSIIGNITVGFDFAVNYKWIALIVLSCIAFKDVIKKRHIFVFQTIITCIIIFVLFPNGWITSGGNSSITMSYAFLICICVCFIFQGKTRVFFLISEVLVVLSLIVLEMRYPNLIINISLEQQDLLIQMPLTLLAAAYIIIVFSKAYHEERELLRQYSEKLEESNQLLMKISRTDELTGTYNRRYLFERLNEIKTQIKEKNQPVIIIMIDIDNFKTINDQYGHVVGDEVLKRVSNGLISAIENKGFVGRYGGDEFIIVLEDTTVKEGAELTSKIKGSLTKLYDHDEIRITVSGGMAQLAIEDDIDDVLSNVDKLLYRVKHGSKDNILFEDECEAV